MGDFLLLGQEHETEGSVLDLAASCCVTLDKATDLSGLPV